MKALLRILSAAAGIVVLLASAVFTLGTSLAAPIGVFVGHRLARRKGRWLTGFSSWVSATAASSVGILLIFVILFASNSADIWQAMEQPAQADTAELPEWITRAFPQSAQPDPMTEKIVGSPAFTAYFAMVGLVIACVLLGTVAGSAGWLGVFLLGYAFRSGRAP